MAVVVKNVSGWLSSVTMVRRDPRGGPWLSKGDPRGMPFSPSEEGGGAFMELSSLINKDGADDILIGEA